MVRRKPPIDDAWWVVLGDLGLSRHGDLSSGSTTIRGTPSYMAPETIGAPFLGRPNDADPFRADMWCLGETIAYALTGQNTFSGSKQLLSYQRHNILFPDSALKQSSASVDTIDFVRSLLQADPLRRPTASQALHHPWINGNRAPQSQPRKNFIELISGHTKNASNRGFTNVDRITEASAQWTQTVSMRVNEANTQPESPMRTAVSPTITPNLSDRSMVPRSTSISAIARRKRVFPPRQASSPTSSKRSEVGFDDAYANSKDVIEDLADRTESSDEG